MNDTGLFFNINKINAIFSPIFMLQQCSLTYGVTKCDAVQCTSGPLLEIARGPDHMAVAFLENLAPINQSQGWIVGIEGDDWDVLWEEPRIGRRCSGVDPITVVLF